MKLIINVNRMTERDWEDIKAFIETQFTSDRDITNGKYSNGSINFTITADYHGVDKINISRK